MAPVFTLHKPSLEVPTIAGSRLRNEAGLCAFAKCGNSIEDGNVDTMIFGKICESCHEKMMKVFRQETLSHFIEEEIRKRGIEND